MREPAKNVFERHLRQGETYRLNQKVNFPPLTSTNQGFELGEHHLNGIEIWAVRRQEEERAPTLLNQLLHTGPMMRGEIVEHDHLPWGQGWTQHFADVPLENSAVYGTLNNERRKGTARLECTNQRLIFAPVAWSLTCCPLMTWRSAIQTSERGVEAAFVQKNQFSGVGRTAEISPWNCVRSSSFRSLATSVFFMGDPMPSEDAINGAIRRFETSAFKELVGMLL